MAQMESRWIDNRSFEQITLETVPTGKYTETYKMILENPKLFQSDFSAFDWDIAKCKQKIQELNEEVRTFDTQIEKIKNPKKKMKQKRDCEDDEEDESMNIALQLDKLQAVITEKQNALKNIKQSQMELQILKFSQEMSIKKYKSFNRLIKDYIKNQDAQYLEKGVHWISEYADKMIEREKNYITNRSLE
jgi:predicted RNase H-like nuclease (RuvC/YqgF family)